MFQFWCWIFDYHGAVKSSLFMIVVGAVGWGIILAFRHYQDALCRNWLEIILGGLALLALISAFVPWSDSLWLGAGQKKWSGEATRSLALVLGGLGALYGLILAAQRQITFSKQVNTAERNLFNDRLGRGVELLSDAKMTMRSAGVRVLENLASGTDADSEEHRLVFDILLDFVRDKAKPPLQENGVPFTTSDEDWPPTEPRNNRLDIKLAILAIGKITPATMRMQINLAGLDLRGIDLRRADLSGAYMVSCDLRQSLLIKTNLQGANLEEACLDGTWIMRANLRNARLSFSSLNEARSVIGADISGAHRDGWKKEILKDAVYDRDKPPQDYGGGSITSLSTSHRAYESREVNGKRKRVFVQSDMPESGQDVDVWVANEIGNAGYDEDDDS